MLINKQLDAENLTGGYNYKSERRRGRDCTETKENKAINGTGVDPKSGTGTRRAAGRNISMETKVPSKGPCLHRLEESGASSASWS